MKYILTFLTLFLFLGCTTKVPVAIKYKIDGISNIQKIENSTCMNESLKVMQSFSSSMLMSSNMYYVEDKNKVYAYSSAQWAKTPNRIISDEYFKLLRELDIFKAVLSSKTRTKTTWILESNLEEYMQYFEDDFSRSYVIISIDLTLIDSKTSQVIATEVFKSKVEVQTMDSDGGVKAFNIALNKILNDSSIWFISQCQ
ncbi:MAG: ABC-type transport auxiliary lipoprotein family protein [Sulfurimonas sp.]|nr:ABC-type transport auxiliary lipoprotein family protein [Sulfurimonas sp.]